MNEETRAAEPSELTVDEIVRELDAPSWELPERALRAAQRRREEITPRLIQAIQDATAQAASGHDVQGNLYFLALFLLAEFRAKEALPAVLEAVSLPGELPFDLFDEASATDFPGLTPAQARNRRRLRDAMIRAGFVPYAQEWWHFTLKGEPFPATSFDQPVR